MIRTNPSICVLPLGGEDAVEDGALPAVSHRLQDEHVLDDVEGETVIREGTQELGLQEGCPFLLQHPLATFIPLQKVTYVILCYRRLYVSYNHNLLTACLQLSRQTPPQKTG